MPMKNLAKHLSTKVTLQTAPIPGRESEMVRNEAGGYTFPVDDWVRLDRFLILGSEGVRD
jgi:60 kDa SS-A/Ro ribonucleoprotein